MRQEQQRNFDSLLRVRDFMQSQMQALHTLESAPALQQLQGAIAAIGEHATAQGTADRSLAGRVGRQRALVEELIRRYMTPIAKFARAKLRGAPDFAALTSKPDGRKPKVLVQAARSMARATAPYADALNAAGFPKDTIEKFNATIDALAETLAQRGHLRVLRVGSTRGLQDQLRVGREAVKLLDAVLTQQFAFDDTFLAAWRSASRVDLKSGSSRGAAAAVEEGATATQ